MSYYYIGTTLTPHRGDMHLRVTPAGFLRQITSLEVFTPCRVCRCHRRARVLIYINIPICMYIIYTLLYHEDTTRFYRFYFFFVLRHKGRVFYFFLSSGRHHDGSIF